jgi:hypothetical protein
VLRQSSKYYKDVKIKVIESTDVLVALPQEPVKKTDEAFSKWFDEAWKREFGY